MGCSPGADNLAPGATAYIAATVKSAISGTNAYATIKVCNADGGGDRVTRHSILMGHSTMIGVFTIEAGALVKPAASNLSTSLPDTIPQ